MRRSAPCVVVSCALGAGGGPAWLTAAARLLRLVRMCRMHCHQPLEAFCLYVGSGCPSCWSEMDIMPD